jgi:hypothetical protein
MKTENINSFERLSLFCHISGLFSVFLGMAVAVLDLTNGDMRHVQVGIYVFITGYALVKISSKISAVLLDESSSRRS